MRRRCCVAVVGCCCWPSLCFLCCALSLSSGCCGSHDGEATQWRTEQAWAWPREPDPLLQLRPLCPQGKYIAHGLRLFESLDQVVVLSQIISIQTSEVFRIPVSITFLRSQTEVFTAFSFFLQTDALLILLVRLSILPWLSYLLRFLCSARLFWVVLS